MTLNPLNHPSPLAPAPAGQGRSVSHAAHLELNPARALSPADGVALPGPEPLAPRGGAFLAHPALPAPLIQRQRRERLRGGLMSLMAMGDGLAIVLAYLAAPLILGATTLPGAMNLLPGQAGAVGPPGAASLLAALVSALLWVLCLAAGGTYDLVLLGRRADLSTRLLRASFMAVVLQILLLFALRPAWPLPGRMGLTAFWIMATTGLLLLRWTLWRGLFVRFLRNRPMGSALVVGAGAFERERAAKLLRWMLFPPAVVGYSGGEDVVEEIEALAREGSIDQVIVTREDLARDTLVELVQRCVALGLTVTAASHAFDVMIGRTPVTVIDGMPVLEIQPSGLFGPARRLKRAIDFGGAFAGGLVLLPLFGLIALAVKLTSAGPVLYRQQRVGRGGRVFHFYKFRTMVVNNDEARHRAYLEQLVRSGSAASVDPQGNKIYKLVDDPRVTRLGGFLRRTSLDELPQLWNVLKGDMSLVGPRPCLHYEWELHKDWQKRRLDVTPGLTGLWQVTGRSRVSFEEMVLLDLYYIARWSIGLDMELILRTIPVMLFGLGGH